MCRVLCCVVLCCVVLCCLFALCLLRPNDSEITPHQDLVPGSLFLLRCNISAVSWFGDQSWKNRHGHWVCWMSTGGNNDSLTHLEPQSRFGDKLLRIRVLCPQNGTAVLNGLTAVPRSSFFFFFSCFTRRIGLSRLPLSSPPCASRLSSPPRTPGGCTA